MILVHQTVETDLWGARKFGVLPESAKISKSSNIPSNPPPHNRFVYGSHPIWQEYDLLKRARDEHQHHVVTAIDQRLIHVPREAPNTEPDDSSVVEPLKHRISFTREYAPLGDIRHFMKEHLLMFIEESFYIWVGRQSLVGLEWVHHQNILHADVKPANILAFHGR